MDFVAQTLTNTASSFGQMFEVISYVWFIIFPIGLYYLFTVLWMDHIQRRFAGKKSFVLLEIITPQNIEKSPQPMEALYAGIAGVMKTPNIYEEFLDGYLTDSFSLELVGTGGEGVHFYIRTPKNFRYLVEAHLYAQYPDMEIREVPDYVENVPPVVPNKDWDLWGSDLQLTDPEYLPIKTYRNFEEDVTGKMIDPLAGLIEIMGQLQRGQHVWLQYVITPIGEPKSKKMGQEYVQELAGRTSKKKSPFEVFLSDLGDIVKNVAGGLFSPPEFSSKGEEKKDDQPLEFRLTPGERRVLEALESNVGKNFFNTKVRLVYLGKKEGFDKSTFVSGFMGGMKQFSDMNYNGFKPNDISKTYANYVMQESRLRYRQRKIFNRYKDRDTDDKKVMLSTEELATLFHPPDMMVISPFFEKVSAKRGSAPSNLPF